MAPHVPTNFTILFRTVTLATGTIVYGRKSNSNCGTDGAVSNHTFHNSKPNCETVSGAPNKSMSYRHRSVICGIAVFEAFAPALAAMLFAFVGVSGKREARCPWVDDLLTRLFRHLQNNGSKRKAKPQSSMLRLGAIATRAGNQGN